MSKRRLSLAVLAVVLLGATTGVRSEPAASGDPALAARVQTIVMRYSEALKAGDCRGLERLLAPSAFETYRTLCEQNTEYPRFLRDFYRNASFWTSDVQPDGSRARCTLHIQTAEGETSQAMLILERHRGRKWRIARIDS